MSMVEDMRKGLQDFPAPELRAIASRIDGLEKQRVEDKADLLRVIGEGKSDILWVIAEGKSDTSRAMEQIEKQRGEDKADTLRAISESTKQMQKRFELVIDYTKVLERVDKLEESQQAKNH